MAKEEKSDNRIKRHIKSIGENVMPLQNKIYHKSRSRSELLQIDFFKNLHKADCEIILNVDKLDDFFLKSGWRQGHPFSTPPFKTVLEFNGKKINFPTYELKNKHKQQTLNLYRIK